MYNYKAYVTHIVDGDTIDVDVDLGFHVKIRQRLRLARVNTPERGEPGFKEATDMVKKLCPVGSEVIISTSKTGKYGRWIAEVQYQSGHNLSDKLLSEGLAKPYPS